MSGEQPTVVDRPGWRTALRIAAAVAALIVLVHAVWQGIGSYGTWAPCWAEGYTSQVCSDIQYVAPTPDWYFLWMWWFVELPLAIVVFVLAIVARHRLGWAFAAMICVLFANVLFDYAFTPAVNGGFVSADNPPGHGLVGAVLLVAAGILFLVIALTPGRTPAGDPGAPRGVKGRGRGVTAG